MTADGGVARHVTDVDVVGESLDPAGNRNRPLNVSQMQHSIRCDIGTLEVRSKSSQMLLLDAVGIGGDSSGKLGKLENIGQVAQGSTGFICRVHSSWNCFLRGGHAAAARMEWSDDAWNGATQSLPIIGALG